ncbi:MAG TPA: hypothetical protein VEV38_01690, partial [Candidatus Eremiobacteraceae bacterium]|nr:hypothetical protein [Candidatus Eremiobacteraceae bacterium]
LTKPHPLQFDADYQEVITGGKNGVISAYTPEGKKIGQSTMPTGVDQCTLDASIHILACAGDGKLWTMQLERDAAPHLISSIDTGHKEVHTVTVDPKTHWMWTVWWGPSGDYVQAYKER